MRYFPLDDLPPLAFRSNQRAIDACVALHRDEWRIQDSFHAVQQGDDVPLLSTPAIRVIEEHSASIAQAWFDEMLTSPHDPVLPAPRSRGDARHRTHCPVPTRRLDAG